MGGSPGNTIEQRARAPAGRHTSLLCLGTRNSISPGIHVGAFFPVVPSTTQTAWVSPLVSPLGGWAPGSYGLPRASAHGLTHSAPPGLEPGRYYQTRGHNGEPAPPHPVDEDPRQRAA